MPKTTPSLATLAASLVLAGTASAQIQIQSLGALEPGVTRCDAISRDGSVAAVQLFPGLAARTESEGFVPLSGTAGIGLISGVRMSGDGRYIFGFPSTTIAFAVRWDSATGDNIVLPVVSARSVVATSDDGTIAVGATGDFLDYRAFRWSETAGVQILEDPNGVSLIPTDMTPDGSVIVGRTNVTANRDRAFRWTAAGGVQILQDVPGDVGLSVRVSDDGRIIAGTYETATSARQPFRWTVAQGRRDLGTLTGGATSETLLLSGDGSTIVGADLGASSQIRIPYRWTTQTGHVRLAPITRFLPTGVSDDGDTICGNDLRPSPQTIAYRWTTTDGLERLPKLNPNGSVTEARGISGDGRVIFGIAANQFGPTYAVIWKDDGSLGETACDPAQPNSTGAPARLRLTGSNLLANDELVIEGSSLPALTTGFTIVSRDLGFVANPGGSQGDLCLSGAIGRFVAPGQVWQTNAAGAFSLTVSPNAFPHPMLGTVATAFDESWSFQAWYRDANPAATSNLTNAVSVRFY